MNEEALRIDRWLWRARFFKTRALAAKIAASGRIRVNRQRIAKTNRTVKPGDVLTFPQGGHIRVVRVKSAGARRGPAEEARALYEDLAPPDSSPPLHPHGPDRIRQMPAQNPRPRPAR